MIELVETDLKEEEEIENIVPLDPCNEISKV